MEIMEITVSSQICYDRSNHPGKMPLEDRIYLRPECGHTQDRDLNAVKNIERWFQGIFVPDRSEMAVSSTVSVCGLALA
jgi:putative transposase